MAQYHAADIEVLSGLDPVRKRPGMYTDTASPDHLAQEVVDSSIDEALAGNARTLTVDLRDDGWLEVADDGRVMPVDLHPKFNKPGVEIVLTTLCSGAKFSNKNYQYAGGLHGVGVSVVNALSRYLEIWIERDGKEYNMGFRSGKVQNPFEEVGAVNVTSIKIAWHGLVTPAGWAIDRWNCREHQAVQLVRGDELARFRLGTTVVVLHTAADWRWDEAAAGQALRYGQPLAVPGSGAVELKAPGDDTRTAS